MQCSICRSDNPMGARFCNQCGTALVQLDDTDYRHRFFDDQLAKLQRYLPQGLIQKVLSQRALIEGERRQATVMFCDMEGFTPLVERLGAEVAYSVMGQIYEILIREVHDCEGTINEMTGDGIMALFGAPIALEEASQRALWAACAIHNKIALFNRNRNEQGPIRMRIGIHAGPIVVGTLGNDLRVEFKAVGDTVNLAARMEQLADPGTTYVTHEVYYKTQGMFEFEKLGKKTIKGWTESIPVYKVLPGRKAIHRPLLGAERMILSEMVGRKPMLDKLVLQTMKLINGAGSIVNIIGEAGIGKSRLLAELKQREAVRSVTLLEGRAISMGRNLSFHPIIDLLKQWAQVGVGNTSLEAFVKLETAIRNVIGEKVGEVLPFVATLMGMQLPAPYGDRLKGIEGEALEKLILKCMRELFTQLSKTSPLVIAIDDLHWADKSTIELLTSLYRLAEHERILFINLYRPDYIDTSQPLLDSLQNNASLHIVDLFLKPLGNRDSETLIANILNLRGIHHAVVDKIVERAGGNPYFIEEVVRSFIDQGAVIVRDGKFEMTPQFSNMTIPDTINEVVMARIDRLEEETRDLIKVAAVIGRSFFYRVLSEVASTVRNLDARLSYLKEAQLIQERRRMEELEYLFSHALAQEAAYASILPEKRKVMHLKVAETIEKVFAEKLHAFYGMLAYHYSRAENLQKTEEALLKAGEAALKTSASSEALHYYLAALELYRRKSNGKADPGKIARIEKNIALALYSRGQYEEALDYFDRAIACAWGPLPKHALAIAYRLAGAFVHFLTALYLPALKFNKQHSSANTEEIAFKYKKNKALSIIDPKRLFIEAMLLCKETTRFDLSHFDLGLDIYIASSSLFSFTGLSFRLSKKILDTSMKIVQPNQPKLYIIYDLMRTAHDYLSGNWSQINRHDIALVKSNLGEGNLYMASQHLYWHGCPCLYEGNLETALELSNELSNIAEIYEHDFSILLSHMLKIKILIESRKLTQAQSNVEDAIDFARKKGFRITLLDFYSCKARILTLLRDLDQAAACLRLAEEVQRAVSPAPIQRSIYLRCKLEYLLIKMEADRKDGSSRVSTELKKDARTIANKLVKITKKAAQHRTEALRLKGRLHLLLNQPKVALKWFLRSAAEGERLGARLELSRTYFEIGKHLNQGEGSPDRIGGVAGKDYLERAGKMFDAMGLQWDQNRLIRMQSE